MTYHDYVKNNGLEKQNRMLKTAVLFSGGKDSMLALSYAIKHTDVKCLITIASQNPESYMFHTPNINLTREQSLALQIPIIYRETVGEKESELDDLKRAIIEAIERYEIEGVVTGAINSIYQASRVQKITNDLKIECFNPLWQKDQIELLNELITEKFSVMIAGTFGEGLDKFLGRIIDEKFIDEISKVKYINPAGEGGEFESFVLNCPLFKEEIKIKKQMIIKDKSGGQIIQIDEIERVKKNE